MTARAALLTAASRGAVAVVRLWGPDALALADRVFRPNRAPALSGTPPGRLRVGRVGAGLGDEVVAVFEGDPPEVEIHCHAGTAAVALVLDALREAGAAVVSSSDRFEAEAGSRLEAEALADLARAPTIRAAEILLDQAEGALRSELVRLGRLLGTEAAREEVRAGIDRLLARAEVGLRLLDGWRVVLAGRPNVGKSRLLNALAGFERAIVSRTPGTTRDVLTVRTAIDGWAVELVDTAGLRESDDPIESAGVALARAEQARADLVVLVLDRSAPLTKADQTLRAAWPASLVVASKADLPPAWEAPELDALPVSAEQGAGLRDLLDGIGRTLVPRPPEPGAAVPFRFEQVRALQRIRLRLSEGRPEIAARWIARAVGPAEGAGPRSASRGWGLG